ncbi:MAG: deoxynucleoside kinase [Bacteroidaceae bacterium]|nr:deoxynucleoside kinase [Bacteroidaceae bacterium]
MYIVTAGNMGSGKTTLTRLLCKRYGWTPRYEQVASNPYIEDYYKDIPRWVLPMEVFFLKERFRDLLAINAASSQETIIQDRSIFEGVYVFAKNNYEMGNMQTRDFETYMELFESMMMVAKKPDLMVYLRASVPHLVENIQKRGREYEQGLSIDYLRGLNKHYDDFIYQQYDGPCLVIDVDQLDYEHRPEDFQFITDRIESRLFGLFGKEPV